MELGGTAIAPVIAPFASAGRPTQQFEEHVLRLDDLKAALASAVQGYLSQLDGLENELLVAIRQDGARLAYRPKPIS